MVGVQMLDIFIYKGDRFHSSGRLDWRPFIKPTSRSVPLTSSSMHSRHIHQSWPVAEISRMHQLSLHQSDFDFFKQIKIDRFVAFGLDEQVVRHCREWQPCVQSTIAQGSPQLSRCFVLSFPYNRIFEELAPLAAQRIQILWNQLLARVLGCIGVRCVLENFGQNLRLNLR